MPTVTQPYWRVWGWDRAQLCWTLRSAHPDPDAARKAAALIKARQGCNTRVEQYTRQVVAVTPPPPPTAAKQFREAQADRMVLRRQTHAYFKSGSNGTEILHDPTHNEEN